MAVWVYRDGRRYRWRRLKTYNYRIFTLSIWRPIGVGDLKPGTFKR